MASINSIISRARYYASNGLVDELKALKKSCELFPDDASIITAAAINGHFNVITWWKEQQLIMCIDLNEIIMVGRLDVIKWLRSEQLLDTCAMKQLHWHTERENGNTQYFVKLSNAAKYGHIDIIAYFILKLKWFNRFIRPKYSSDWKDESDLFEQLHWCIRAAIKRDKHHVFDWVRHNFGAVLGMPELVQTNYAGHNSLDYTDHEVDAIRLYQVYPRENSYTQHLTLNNLNHLHRLVYLHKLHFNIDPSKYHITIGSDFTEHEIRYIAKELVQMKFTITGSSLFSPHIPKELSLEMKLTYPDIWNKRCRDHKHYKKQYRRLSDAAFESESESDHEEVPSMTPTIIPNANSQDTDSDDAMDYAIPEVIIKLPLDIPKEIIKLPLDIHIPIHGRISHMNWVTMKKDHHKITQLFVQTGLLNDEDAIEKISNYFTNICYELSSVDLIDTLPGVPQFKLMLIDVVEISIAYNYSFVFEYNCVYTSMLKYLMSLGVARDHIHFIGEIGNPEKRYVDYPYWGQFDDFCWLVENKFWWLCVDSLQDIFNCTPAYRFDPWSHGLGFIQKLYPTELDSLMPQIIEKYIMRYLDTQGNSAYYISANHTYNVLLWIKSNYPHSFVLEGSAIIINRCIQCIRKFIQDNHPYNYIKEGTVRLQGKNRIVCTNSEEICAICAICADIMKTNQLCAKLNCNHMYHYECINEYLKVLQSKSSYDMIEHLSCPYCKQDTPVLASCIHPMIVFLEGLIEG
jgi:hypothetical protein